MYYVLCAIFLNCGVSFSWEVNNSTVAAKLDVERKIRINDRNQACGGPINFNAALFN